MRRLAVALGACLMAPSATLHALGMGDIDVHSGLNQPLKATIKLISVDEGELNGLDVALAPKAAFERMGLDRLPVLSKLSFNVVKDKGAPYIEVTSQVPVREPFLDFILSVNWANGQLLREYTLLLDPPVFDKSEKASPVEAAVTSPATIEREAMDEFEQTSKREVTFNAGPGSYGPTKTTDTLWAIAKSMRPDASVSVPQMMLALLKENPEAFLDNNINQLKAGYILRAPQIETITELSKAQAAAEANRQYQAWLQRRGASGGVSGGGQRQVASGAEGAATGLDSVDGGQVPVSKARLQLVSPENAEFVAEAGGSVEGKVAALQQQLLVAQEAAQVSQQESAALRARLKDLEEQLANMKKLISLQDDTMSALQGGLAGQEAESMKPEADSSSETEQQMVAASGGVGAEQSGQEISSSAVDVEEGAGAAPGEDKKSTPVVVRTPPQESSFFDELIANPNTMAIAGGVSALLLLLIGLMIRRRRQSGEDALADVELPPLAGAGAGAAAAATASAVAAASPKSDNESSAAADLFENKEDNGLGETVGDIDEYGGFGSDDLGTIHAEESEIDPIAEADVYLAYRRYEQAESLLKEAIQNDEGRHELKLKLMEIYFTTKDQEAFEAQAEALYAALGGAENGLWDQAVEMGRELCPDHPLFSESGGILPGVPADSDISDDSVLELGDESIAEESHQDLDFESLSGPEPTPVSETDSEFDLDGLSSDSVEFDLDLDESLENDGEEEGAASEVAEVSAEGEASDELDLGLDESFTKTESEVGELGLNLEVGSEAQQSSDPETPVLDGEENSLELDSVSIDDGLADTTNEMDDLELDLPEMGSDVAEMDDEEQRSDSASLEEFSDLDLGIDDEFTSVDVSEEESKVASEEDVLVLDDDGLTEGDDAFDLDALDDLGGLDNVVNFETPETSLGDMEISEDDQLKLEDGVEDLANALGEEADSMTDLSAADEFSQSTAEKAETEAASPEWEVEPAISSFGDMDEEYSLFESTDDVVGTKLDLAKAYIDMGDQDGARSILDEVVKEGSDTQREEAQQLMQQIG